MKERSLKLPENTIETMIGISLEVGIWLHSFHDSSIRLYYGPKSI